MSVAVGSHLSSVPTHWELAAETIAVKIRWFGLLVGYGAKMRQAIKRT